MEKKIEELERLNYLQQCKIDYICKALGKNDEEVISFIRGCSCDLDHIYSFVYDFGRFPNQKECGSIQDRLFY